MPTRETPRRIDPALPAGRASGSGATWFVVVAVFACGAGIGWGGARFGAGVADTGSSALAAIVQPQAADADAMLSDRMLALDPFIVNLHGDDVARYLKVKVELEAETPASRAELEARLPQVRDGVISVLSARDVADVTSFEGKVLLKQDLQDRVNGLLHGGRVRSVLFTEYVVQ